MLSKLLRLLARAGAPRTRSDVTRQQSEVEVEYDGADNGRTGSVVGGTAGVWWTVGEVSTETVLAPSISGMAA